MEVTLSCGFCGDIFSLDAFCEAPVYGTLPKNIYQCPGCRRAIERKMDPPKVLSSGFVMPGKIRIIEVPGYL
jgi:hypothetical protein